MVLYLDMQFLVQFLMNYLVLRLLSYVLLRRLWKKRCVLGAVLGALLACAWVFVPVRWKSAFQGLVGIGIAALMCWAAIPVNKCSQLILATVLFLMGSFFVSGFVQWLLEHTFLGYLIYYEKANAGGTTALMLLLGLAAGVKRYVQRNKGAIRTAWVQLSFGKCSFRFRALRDSGNCLKSGNGEPVEVMEMTLLEQFVPELYKAVQALENGEELNHLQQCYLERFHLSMLPYRSAGGDGVFMTVMFDCLEIEEPWGNQIIYNPIIALQKGRLTDQKDSYQGIIHL